MFRKITSAALSKLSFWLRLSSCRRRTRLLRTRHCLRQRLSVLVAAEKEAKRQVEEAKLAAEKAQRQAQEAKLLAEKEARRQAEEAKLAAEKEAIR